MRSLFLWGETTFGVGGIWIAIMVDRLCPLQWKCLQCSCSSILLRYLTNQWMHWDFSWVWGCGYVPGNWRELNRPALWNVYHVECLPRGMLVQLNSRAIQPGRSLFLWGKTYTFVHLFVSHTILQVFEFLEKVWNKRHAIASNFNWLIACLLIFFGWYFKMKNSAL